MVDLVRLVIGSARSCQRDSERADEALRQAAARFMGGSRRGAEPAPEAWGPKGNAMRGIVVGIGAALALLIPAAAWAQDGQPGLGEPRDGFDHLTNGEPRPAIGEALERSKFDDAVGRMFAAADTDRDGSATLAELRTVFAGRKDAAIRDRFAVIDANRDRSLSYAEFSQWLGSLGSLALSDREAATAATGIVPEDIRPERGRGRGSDIVADLVEPLGATVLVAANADHDGGTTLAELLAYEGKRFDAADANRDGWVVAEELRSVSPRPRTGG